MSTSWQRDSETAAPNKVRAKQLQATQKLHLTGWFSCQTMNMVQYSTEGTHIRVGIFKYQESLKHQNLKDKCADFHLASYSSSL